MILPDYDECFGSGGGGPVGLNVHLRAELFDEVHSEPAKLVSSSSLPC